jgi:hypothetical protein
VVGEELFRLVIVRDVLITQDAAAGVAQQFTERRMIDFVECLDGRGGSATDIYQHKHTDLISCGDPFNEPLEEAFECEGDNRIIHGVTWSTGRAGVNKFLPALITSGQTEHIDRMARAYLKLAYGDDGAPITKVLLDQMFTNGRCLATRHLPWPPVLILLPDDI